jgi:hypothetical protein
MTEDEAKTKWCPMAREVGEKISNNRHGFGFAHTMCIASACMMWSWNERHYMDDVPPKTPKQGRCGLAK